MTSEEKNTVASAEAADDAKNGNYFDLHWQKIDVTFADGSVPPLKGVFTHDGCGIEDQDKQSTLKTRVEKLHPKTVQIRPGEKCQLQ
jgi:hypothetical protein